MENTIQKSINIIIDETKKNIIEIINNSGLSASILDMIISGIYSEVHSIAEQQLANDYLQYNNALTASISEKETETETTE